MRSTPPASRVNTTCCSEGLAAIGLVAELKSGVPLAPVVDVRILVLYSSASWASWKLRLVVLSDIVAMRDGPPCVLFAGLTQASTVISFVGDPPPATALKILLAAPVVEINVSPV